MPSFLFREIRSGIGRHPLRSILVSCTFAIGFASVLVTIATVEGGRRSIREMLLGLGVDVIACFNPMEIGPVHIGDLGGSLIDQAVVEDLRSELAADVRQIIPLRLELAAIYHRDLFFTTTLMATTTSIRLL